MRSEGTGRVQASSSVGRQVGYPIISFRPNEMIGKHYYRLYSLLLVVSKIFNKYDKKSLENKLPTLALSKSLYFKVSRVYWGIFQRNTKIFPELALQCTIVPKHI